MTTLPIRAMRLAATLLAAPLVLPLAAAPAHSQWTVFDPTNYAQNVLQAARALEQINNQIASLQNEAQMLAYQARHLTRLPYSSLQQLETALQRTQRLLDRAQRIAYDIQAIDRAFETIYGDTARSGSDRVLIETARVRWQNTVAGLQDAMRVQSGAVGHLGTTRTEMAALIGHSQGAAGALQAAQAGNQLLALQGQQLADLTALIAANGRARALAEAERAASAAQGREQRRRFLAPGTGYRPGRARMFYAEN